MAHFQQLIVDMGASATNGTSLSLETSSSLSYIKQLYLDSFYVKGASAERLRIFIKAAGVSTGNTAVLSDRSNISVGGQKGGREIYEIHPFAGGEGRQTFSSPYAVLESPINRKVSALEVSVTNWTGDPVTYTDLVFFFRVECYPPSADPTGTHRLMRDPLLSEGLNEF